MKGTIILTEGRSGSSWFVSLSNGTGQLGTGGEWFSKGSLGKPRPADRDSLIRQVLAKASTPNGHFSVKLFPAHLHYVSMKYGFDLIQFFLKNHDIQLIRITRADRLRQAISFARGLQTNQWTVHHNSKREPSYDFELICRCYFMIGQSYKYWESYTQLFDLPASHFVYEEMLPSPMPYLQCVAGHGGIVVSEIPPSKHSIQRDSSTEAWIERFKTDLAAREIVDLTALSRRPTFSVSNLMRLLGGRALKPYPYMF